MTSSPRPSAFELVKLIFTNQNGGPHWYQAPVDEENPPMKKCLAAGEKNINAIEGAVGEILRKMGLPDSKRVCWQGLWGRKEQFLVLELDVRTWQSKVQPCIESHEKLESIFLQLKELYHEH